MRALQKLSRNGNATTISIPRAILAHLGWLPGEAMIVEVLENHEVLIRRPRADDFAPVTTPRLIFDVHHSVKP